MRILLVEDDVLIGNGIKVGLSQRGFVLDWFADGELGRTAPTAAEYDAAILDLSLPGVDGLDILRAWRKAGVDLPVLILTARDALSQKIEGLDLGADDYLTKPFELEELAARLRALLRRRHGAAGNLLEHGRVSFDPAARTVFLEDAPVALGPREIMLVELLLRSGSRVLSKGGIEEKLHPWGDEVSDNSVEVLVHRVRRKLGQNFVKTIHGLGYALGDPA